MQDNEGNTALMYACFMGNTEIVKVLADAHNKKQIVLNLDATNSDGLTALLYARDCSHEDIVKVLTTCLSDDKAGCFMCHQEPSDKKPRQSITSRINELAENIEVSAVGQEIEVNTETKPNKTNTEHDTNSADVYHSQKTTKENEEFMTSKDVTGPVTHIPEARDDYVKTLLDLAETSQNENKNILEINALFVAESANFPDRTELVSKKSKRETNHTKGKRKKRKSENHSENTDRPSIVQHYTTDECGVDRLTYPSVTENKTTDIQETDVTLLRRIVMDNAKRELYKTLSIERDRPFVEIDTGKMDCLDLEPEEKARVFGRTVWSVYGAPLPPIPVDDKAVKRVVDEISDVRKYFGGANCQEGRLVNLDPELWCILESMRPAE